MLYQYEYKLKGTGLFWYRGLATGKTWKEAKARAHSKYPNRLQIKRIKG